MPEGLIVPVRTSAIAILKGELDPQTAINEGKATAEGNVSKVALLAEHLKPAPVVEEKVPAKKEEVKKAEVKKVEEKPVPKKVSKKPITKKVLGKK